MKDSIVQTLRVSCLPTNFVRDFFLIHVYVTLLKQLCFDGPTHHHIHVFIELPLNFAPKRMQYSCKLSVIFVRV
jgi:hypothetical protein